MLPTTPKAWLNEIVTAYADAHETIPFGPLVDATITEKELFHLAPAVCLKFRGLTGSKRALKRATDAALASYVVMVDKEPEALLQPEMAFAFCYLAAHFGLDLVAEDESTEVLEYVASHVDELVRNCAKVVRAT